MNTSPKTQGATEAFDPGDLESKVVKRFEQACEQALTGGPQPAIETFVAETIVSRQPAFRRKLEQIQETYRRRRLDTPAQANAATVDLNPGGSAASSAPPLGATIAHVPDSAAAQSGSPSPSASAATGVWQDGGKGAELGRTMAHQAEDDTFQLADEVESRSAARPAVAGYEILSELGRGGMGVVYKARDIKLNRTVALKMVLAGAHAGKDQLARFNTEAQAVAHLQHPNIIQIYEVGEQAGLPYFSLEFVDGGCLSDKLAGKPQLPPEAAEMVATLARAMHHAHEHRVVHRDLKPANVLLTSAGHPKITDFGLAKRLEDETSSQTRSGAILGTPSYMAPEQALGEVHLIGPLTDVYALGAMLYELLTGRPPFLAATPMDTVIQVTRDEPVPPTQLQPKVPRDLETICLKCLQKEQPKRYASAQQLADDLDRFLKGEPILARPVSAPERFWRWCRRNPGIASLSAGVAALLVITAAVSIVAAVQIHHKKELAIQARELAEKKEAEARYAQGKAETAERSAADSARVAGDQRRLALETLYRVITQIEQKLRDRADMNDLRQDVLKEAMQGLENLSRTDENLAFADRAVGAAHQRLADVLLRAGRSDEAQNQFMKGLTIFNKLIADDPDNDRAIYNAALCYDGLGDVSRKLREDATVARRHYLKGLELRELLDKMHHSPELKPIMIHLGLINSYGRLGGVAQELSCDPLAAMDYNEKAMRQSEQLIASEFASAPAPMKTLMNQALAGALFVVGKVHCRLGDPDAARDFLERSKTIREAAHEADPLSVKARQDLAGSYAGLGELELQLNQPEAALAYFDKAHTLRVELHSKDSDNLEMKVDLAASYYRLGAASTVLGRMPEAEQLFRESLALRQTVVDADPNNASKQIDLMLSHARCGQHAEASKMADEMRNRLFPNPGTLFSIACTYALCAESIGHGSPGGSSGSAPDDLREHYKQNAIQSVQQAIEQGFRDRISLVTDPDLAPIRSEKAFQELVNKLR